MLIQLATFMEGRLLTEGPEIAAQIRKEFLAAGQAPVTINRNLAVVRRQLSLSYRRWGWLDQPLHQHMQMLREAGERHIYLTRENVKALAAVWARTERLDGRRLSRYIPVLIRSNSRCG